MVLLEDDPDGFFCLMYLIRKELQEVFSFFLSLQSLYAYLHDWNSWDGDMKVNAAVARRKCLSDATNARIPDMQSIFLKYQLVYVFFPSKV